MARWWFTGLLAFGLVCTSSLASAAAVCDRELTIQLDGHEPFQLFLQCWEGPGAKAAPHNVLMIHGFAHNSAVFEPGARWVIETYPEEVGRVYALDLPGHGLSEYPFDLRLGQLDLNLYLATIRQTLEAFEGELDIVIGHSMGGLLLQMLQQQLLSEGSQMNRPRTEGGLGVAGVMLLAPSIPEEVDWAFAEGIVNDEGPVSELLLELLPYLRVTPEDGMYIKGTPKSVLETFFTPPGQLFPVPGAPVGLDLNQITDIEPFTAAAQVGGIDPSTGFERPHIAAGVFSPELQPVFSMVSFADDLFWTKEEQQHLFEYLREDSHTSGPPASAFFWMDDDQQQMVHDCPYSSANRCLGIPFSAMMEQLH